jgi:hypothetical protein
MNYLDEFGLSDDDIKAIDKDIEEANEFFAKVSVKDSFIGESTEYPKILLSFNCSTKP